MADWFARIKARDDYTRAMHPSHDARIVESMATHGADAVPVAESVLARAR